MFRWRSRCRNGGTLLPQWEAIVQWLAGDVRAALASSQAAAAQLVGELSKRRALGVAFAALAAVEAGEPAQAHEHLRRVESALGGVDFLCAGFAAAHAEALLDWYEGSPRDALQKLSDVADGCMTAEASPFAALVLVDLAELAAELVDVEAATDASRRLFAISQTIDRDLYHALAAIASAWSALAADSSEESAELARHAVELLRSSGCSGFHARALDLLGRSLVASDVAAAHKAFDQATAQFRSSGAVWRLDRARNFERALAGSRARRTAALPGDDLSTRERQVARLAASTASLRARSASSCSSAGGRSRRIWQTSTPSSASDRRSSSPGVRRSSS